MSQELVDLRISILQGRYQDALAIVDELEGMSRKSILRNIKSFLIRMLIHLVKNQIEQRMTNSWAASIRDSLIEIQDLNLQENKKAYYIKQDSWETPLAESMKRAVSTASVELCDGAYSPFQLQELVKTPDILETAKELLDLIYEHEAQDLPDIINEYLSQLPGGNDWKFGGRQ
ncbi:MAG: DUF29 family protein [Hormoscilla sp. GM102CHS1]|nr:DUF29 family protein [Hormoscilla sp. GM102CHS1]